VANSSESDEDEFETRTRFGKNVVEPIVEPAAERMQAAPGTGKLRYVLVGSGIRSEGLVGVHTDAFLAGCE
jgi:hypothetical protein